VPAQTQIDFPWFPATPRNRPARLARIWHGDAIQDLFRGQGLILFAIVVYRHLLVDVLEGNMSNEDVERSWDVGANATGNAVGGLLGAALGAPFGPFGVVAGAAVGAVAEDYVKLYAADRARRVRAMSVVVSEVAGNSSDELDSAILGDERKRELLARAIEEAARSIEDQNIRLIAHAFVTGALSRDPAAVDDAMLAIDVARQLRAPHWRLISTLVRASPMGGIDPTNEDLVTRYQFAWTRKEILQADPGLERAFDHLIGQLTSLGLVSDIAVGTWDYTGRWSLNEFGKTCAEYMNVVGKSGLAA
jgi:uncharacterized protein YqgC (DUF456 family)